MKIVPDLLDNGVVVAHGSGEVCTIGIFLHA